MPSHPIRTYAVEVPRSPVTLYRIVPSAAVKAEDFMSNHELGRQRRRGEDEAMFRGISAFESVEEATRAARQINEARARIGLPPVTHLVPLLIDGASGQATARTGGHGHRTNWGNPQGLLSSAGEPLPIEDPIS